MVDCSCSILLVFAVSVTFCCTLDKIHPSSLREGHLFCHQWLFFLFFIFVVFSTKIHFQHLVLPLVYILGFQTVFSKNVVCRYFLFFNASKRAKKIKIGQCQVEKTQFLSILTWTIRYAKYTTKNGGLNYTLPNLIAFFLTKFHLFGLPDGLHKSCQ
jgi:hypothetical protein